MARDPSRPDADRVAVHDPATDVRPEAIHHNPAAAAHAGPTTATIPKSLNLTRDRVRWGPVVAGFLTALTVLIILGVLGLAIGLSAVDTRAAAATGTVPDNTGSFSAIWGAIAGIIAFWVGGFVAGRTAAVFDRQWGMVNGMMVFFLALPVTLWLAAMGAGGLLGILGTIASGVTVDPTTAQTAAGQAAAQVSPTDMARAAEAVRSGAWLTLLGLGLAIGASALGGGMGTRRERQIGDVTTTTRVGA